MTNSAYIIGKIHSFRYEQYRRNKRGCWILNRPGRVSLSSLAVPSFSALLGGRVGDALNEELKLRVDTLCILFRKRLVSNTVRKESFWFPDGSNLPTNLWCPLIAILRVRFQLSARFGSDGFHHGFRDVKLLLKIKQ